VDAFVNASLAHGFGRGFACELLLQEVGRRLAIVQRADCCGGGSRLFLLPRR